MQKIKNKYGSMLVFALIVLFIGVVAALGIASTTVISQKMSGATGKSVGSFQVADSGAEIVLQKIYKGGFDKISKLGTCQDGGVVKGDIGDSAKKYEVIFEDENEEQLSCGDNISDIAKIKSTGIYANTSRAVEMAVAADAASGITGGCNVNRQNGTVSYSWGNGCKPKDTALSSATCEYAADDTDYECGNSDISNNDVYACICVNK